MSKARAQILIVEDEGLLGLLMGEVLGATYEVCLAKSAREALRVFEGKAAFTQAVLVDEHLPDMKGHDLLQKIQALRRPNAYLPCAILTGCHPGDLPEVVWSVPCIAGILQKPFSIGQLPLLVNRLVERDLMDLSALDIRNFFLRRGA